jgi:hypothetical protein
MPGIRAIRVLCPDCDCLLSVLIDASEPRDLRVPDGAIAAVVREHMDAAHPQVPVDPAPEPDATSTTVNIHVHGGVINEQRLRDLVRQEMLNVSMRRDGTPYPSARR